MFNKCYVPNVWYLAGKRLIKMPGEQSHCDCGEKELPLIMKRQQKKGLRKFRRSGELLVQQNAR